MAQANIDAAKSFLQLMQVKNPQKIVSNLDNETDTYVGDNTGHSSGYDETDTTSNVEAFMYSLTDIEYFQPYIFYEEDVDAEGNGLGTYHPNGFDTNIKYLANSIGDFAYQEWISEITPKQYKIGYAHNGAKVARIYRKSPDGVKPRKLLGVNNSINVRYTGISQPSFAVPQDDPQYDKEGSVGESQNIQGYRLQQRTWIYDTALSVYAYTSFGDYATAKTLIDRALIEQEASGSFPFSFDIFIGVDFAPAYIRTGANAWFGAAMAYYTKKSGDTQFLSKMQLLGDWILTQQVTNETDPRYGLCTGGEGAFAVSGYIYTPGTQSWCSVEHNFDCHMFLKELFSFTLDEKYHKAYDLIEKGLMEKAWIESESRFAQGIRPEGLDTSWALDMCTWGGLFLTSIQEWGKAERTFQTALNVYAVYNASVVMSTDPNYYNQVFSSTSTFDGFKPYYDDGNGVYTGAPDVVWAEGTWGFIMLGKRLGKDVSQFENSMYSMQDNVTNSNGAMLAYTATYADLPWEFHAWPATNPCAWLILTNLDPFYSCFPLGFGRLGGVNDKTNKLLKPIADNRIIGTL